MYAAAFNCASEKMSFEFKLQVGGLRFRAAALYAANIIFDQRVAKCSEDFSD